MKVLHLGDLHLGKSVNDFNMIDDQRYILEQVLTMIRDQGIEALLLAGDIYDRSVPSEEAVQLLDYFLCQLSEIGVDTFIISGNHDSEERLHFGSRLFETNHVYISAKYDGTIYKKECQDEFGKINIYLLPFIKASQVKYFYPEEKVRILIFFCSLIALSAVFRPISRPCPRIGQNGTRIATYGRRGRESV